MTEYDRYLARQLGQRVHYYYDLLSRANTLAWNPSLRGVGLSASNRRAIKRLIAKRGKR